VSLFGRIALTGAVLFAIAVALVLLIWKPISQESFVGRTDGLLRDAGSDFGAIATGLVEETMRFASETSRDADEQRARSLQDLPMVLFTDADGKLAPKRLREAIRTTFGDPMGTDAAKHRAVRDEVQQRAMAEVERKLAALRKAQVSAAARHAELESWRTAAAWGGLLLLLLAAWAVVLDRVVLGPLRDATGAVARFGAGERGVRIDPGGASEMAALGLAFNETASAVERTESENEELRSGLERKVAERTAALVRAARASTAGTMAGGVAHEFNNLLGGILGCADAALEEDPKPEVREALEMVRKTASRGVGITKVLLRATRAEPDFDSCDVPALFAEALAEVRPPESVRVVERFEPLRMDADAAMLRQVLSNLVRNGVDAMGGEGELTLGVARDAEFAYLTVEDNGPGIDPSVQEILFEPFVTTRRGGREGAGLGLFLAERMVVAHGGVIEVHSEPGEGTRFTVRIPV
jgi:signal transduction histidine kinase